MVYVLALIAAFLFALGTVLQQKGTLEVHLSGDDPKFFLNLLKTPIWLIGGASQCLGWIIQAVAFDKGSFIIVQTLMATSIVMSLPLGRRLTNQIVTKKVWSGAALAVFGMAVFLSVAPKQSSGVTPVAHEWILGFVMTGLAVVLLLLLSKKAKPSLKALFLGSAAGIIYALQATITKTFITVVGHGPLATLSSWTVYALLLSAVIGFVFQQSALKTGVLAPAFASINALTLFASVLFGITIYDEVLSRGHGHLAIAIFGLAVDIAGIILLTVSGNSKNSKLA